MKIFVVGGVSPSFEEGNDEEKCARAIGRAVTSSGHVLINGCYNNFDRFVAEAAFEAAKENPLFGDPKMAIHTYVAPGMSSPPHRLGHTRNLNVHTWDPGTPDWGLPEPLQECEALVVMGGGPGTHRVVHLSRMVGKPILPITAFGGAAKEAFRAELERFDEVYEGRVPREKYTLLDDVYPEDFDSLARDVVGLVSMIVWGNEVFVVMSFRPESDDTYHTIQRVCKAFGFDPDRTDKSATAERIYQRIVEGIERSAFVVADVTCQSLNVYYELGFAEALGKDVIVIAKEGTELPFDTRDIPTHFFSDQTRLEEALRSRIERLTQRKASTTA